MAVLPIEKITLKKLQAIEGGVWDAIEWAKEQYGPYPERAKKPTEPHHPTAVAWRFYADELEKWERKHAAYEQAKKDYNARESAINKVLQAYLEHEAELHTVPEQYRRKVWERAWALGHSNGFSEVYGHLCSLVEIFND